MLKFATLSIAALTASTAFAQAPSAAPAPTAAPVPAAQPAPAAPESAAQPSTAQAAPDASTATAQAAPASNTNAQVAAVVDAGFPKYDLNKDGKLSEAEFKQWISDLKTQELAAQGKPADAAAVAQYATSALAVADKDKDGVITKQDLTTFLGG